MSKLEKQIRAFCKNMITIREKNEISKEKMALILKISLSELEDIERGILPDSIPCDIIFRIEKNFGISIKEQFSEK